MGTIRSKNIYRDWWEYLYQNNTKISNVKFRRYCK